MSNFGEYGTPVSERLTAALADLFGSLNVLGSNSNTQVRVYFSRQHRTLQQQFVKVVVLPVLQELAENWREGRVDGRNEAAAKLAAKLLVNVTEDDLYLPLI